MAESEAALLASYAQNRDAMAFRALVERHQGMVFAVCKRILGNAADAEDVAQECFLKLAYKAATLRAPIAGWLHRVAAQMSIDLARRDRSRQAREVRVSRAPRSESAALTWEDLKPHIDAMLAQLPDDLRDPLVLYYLEGSKQADIAEALGITQATVSRRLDRGTKALRDALKRAGVVGSVTGVAALLTANALEAAPATLTTALGKMALAGVGDSTCQTAATAGSLALKTKLVAAAAVAAAVAGTTATMQMRKRQAEPVPLLAAAAEGAAKPSATARADYSAIRGTVRERSGDPIPNATIHARRMPAKEAQDRHTEADAKGRYVLRDLSPGWWYLWAEEAGYARMWPCNVQRRVLIPADHPSTMDLALHRPRSQDVLVLTPEGEPLKGARGYVLWDFSGRGDKAFDGPFPAELKATTGPDGRAGFRRLRRGRYLFLVEHEEYGTTWSSYKIIDDNEPVRITMDPGGVIAGMVVHAGKPAAGVAVVLKRIRRFEPQKGRPRVLTDQRGGFQFEALPVALPGDSHLLYSLWIESDEWVSPRFSCHLHRKGRYQGVLIKAEKHMDGLEPEDIALDWKRPPREVSLDSSGQWEAVCQPREMAWPEAPDRIESFGTTWLRVPTTYFRVYFAPDQTGEARQFGERVDSIFEFMEQRTGCMPPVPIDVYLSPTRDVQARIHQAWKGKEGFTTGLLCSSESAIACLASPFDYTPCRVISLLTGLFCRQSQLVRPPASAALLPWRQHFPDYYHRWRLSVDLSGKSLKQYFHSKLQYYGLCPWEQLGEWPYSPSQTVRAQAYYMGAAIYYFIEEQFGAGKATAFWRAALTDGGGRHTSIATLAPAWLECSLEDLEEECALFYGIEPDVSGAAATDLMWGVRLVLSAKYKDALERLERIPVATDAESLSAEQWAQAHHAAGFAHDQLGQRAEAVACYEQALELLDPDTKLHAELLRGLDQGLRRFTYTPVRR